MVSRLYVKSSKLKNTVTTVTRHPKRLSHLESPRSVACFG